MEVGLLKQLERYARRNNIPEVYHLLTDPALTTLTHPGLKTGTVGKFEVAGGRGIYAILQTATTFPPSQGMFEAHRDFLDIHVPLEGVESIGYTPLDSRVSPGGVRPVYDASLSDDVTFANFDSPEEMTIIRLVPGMYAIFEPDDVHMPRVESKGGPAPLRKFVVKVPMKFVSPPDEELLKAVTESGSAMKGLLREV